MLPEDSLRILVVDDGCNAADILALFFEMEGHQAKAVYDGAAAVAVAAEFYPHVIFMDIGMPEMDGLEATRLIRLLPGGENIVIVALTGLDQDDVLLHTGERTTDCHLAKPVKPDDLRQLIQELRQPGATG